MCGHYQITRAAFTIDFKTRLSPAAPLSLLAAVLLRAESTNRVKALHFFL